jgi:hypothetical protein
VLEGAGVVALVNATNIALGDAREWLGAKQQTPEGWFDLILTDPPHLDTFRSRQAHWDFACDWVPLALGALKPDGVLVHSCGADPVELSNYLALDDPDDILVWPHGGERYAETETGFTPGHHYFLVYWKNGPRKLRWSGSTVLARRTSDFGDFVLWERMSKPDDLWPGLISAFVSADAIVADPFCGRGEIPRAARAIGRQWAGCEILPESVDYCRSIGL